MNQKKCQQQANKTIMKQEKIKPAQPERLGDEENEQMKEQSQKNKRPKSGKSL